MSLADLFSNYEKGNPGNPEKKAGVTATAPVIASGNPGNLGNLENTIIEVNFSNRSRILSWLASIGEGDQAIINDVLAKCKTDPEALAFYLRRAKGIEEPAQEIVESPDTVICYTPSGRPIAIAPDNPEHAEWLTRVNPMPLKSVQCKNCQHFRSHNPHGSGSGVCAVNVTPKGITHWFDTQHLCSQFTTI